MNRLFLYSSLIALLALSGCASMSDNGMLDSDTKKAAAIGAVTGAAIGGIAGHQGGHGWEGAAIGAAAGGLGGAAVGHQMDKTKQDAANYIPVTKIVEMTKGGVPSSLIISEIQRTGSKYDMTMDTIDYLKTNGVAKEVMDYMLQAGK